MKPPRRLSLFALVPLLLAALVALVPGQADAQRARVKPKVIPFDFRGHRMGDTLWDDVGCSPISSESGRNERFCGDRDDRIGPATVKIVYRFASDSLVQIAFSYAPDDFEEVVAAFTRKLGRPHKVEDLKIQNRMGATYPDALVSWRTSGGVLAFMRYGSTLDEGFGLIESAAETARKARLLEAARRDPNN